MAQLDSRRRAYLDAMGIDVWLPSRENTPGLETLLKPVDVVEQAGQALVEQHSSLDVDSVVNPAVDEIAASPQLSPDISTLDWSALEVTVASCTLCSLHESRQHTVFGAGNKQADILIVGEAPGIEEDKQGEPFVGQAGQLLSAMLKAIGLDRKDVYLANILKCHPEKNRDPSTEEAERCHPYLKRQVELIQPKIILAVGRIAAQHLLNTNTSLARLREKQHYLDELNIPVIVTYHPAYLLRAPQEKRKAWEDLQFFISKLAEIS